MNLLHLLSNQHSSTIIKHHQNIEKNYLHGQQFQRIHKSFSRKSNSPNKFFPIG